MPRAIASLRQLAQYRPFVIQFNDAANSRILCNGAANYTTSIQNNYTVLTYVNLNAKSTPSGASHAVVSNNAGVLSNNYWLVVQESGRTVQTIITNGSTSQTHTSTAVVPAGWNWIGIAYQQGTLLSTIVNTTVESIAPTLSVVMDNTRQLSISSTNAASRVNGQMARLVIFNGQLTAAELRNFQLHGVSPAAQAVLDWDMTDGTGNITDRSGNSNTGTLSGAVWNIRGPLVSRGSMSVQSIPYSIEFDGSNDYVTVLNSASINSAAGTTQARSFGMWLKTADQGSRIIMEKGSSASFVLQTTSGGLFTGVDIAGASSFSGVPGGNGEWNHVCVTMGSDQVGRYYFNGRLLYTEAGWTGSALNASNLQLGRTAGQVFLGKWTQPFIYSRELTAAEVAGIYRDGIFPASGQVMLLRCTEGTGSTLGDSSGNLNTGTITGAQWSSDVPCKVRTLATGRGIAV